MTPTEQMSVGAFVYGIVSRQAFLQGSFLHKYNVKMCSAVGAVTAVGIEIAGLANGAEVRDIHIFVGHTAFVKDACIDPLQIDVHPSAI